MEEVVEVGSLGPNLEYDAGCAAAAGHCLLSHHITPSRTLGLAPIKILGTIWHTSNLRGFVDQQHWQLLVISILLLTPWVSMRTHI